MPFSEIYFRAAHCAGSRFTVERMHWREDCCAPVGYEFGVELGSEVSRSCVLKESFAGASSVDWAISLKYEFYVV